MHHGIRCAVQNLGMDAAQQPKYMEAHENVVLHENIGIRRCFDQIAAGCAACKLKRYRKNCPDAEFTFEL